MKAAISDSVVLNSLGPLEMMAYLRANGWKRETEIGNKGSIWVHEDDMDVVLPARRQLGDYALRISEVLRTLSEVEERSELDVLRDIQTTTSDLIRIRATGKNAEAGSLPLESAVSFVAHARDLMLAAACATIEKRSVYAKRKPQQAMDYLNHVQMGQTERGSFVLTILSPVPPALRPSQASLLPESEPEDPFERKVTSTLMNSIYALEAASREATSKSDMEPFQSAVGMGVSANLCDAIVGLSASSSGEELTLAMSWSRTRPTSTGFAARNQVQFSNDAIPVIEEAARVFRSVAPQEDYDVTGFVRKSERHVEEAQGDITLDAFVDDKLHSVVVRLPENEYSLALSAHDERKVVTCTGELIKQGRGYRLQNPRHFRILETE
jgi:hypothetical protein